MRNTTMKSFFVAFMLSVTCLGHAQSEAETDLSPVEVARRYFRAFAAHDAEKMNALYSDGKEGIFEDAVFTPAFDTDETRAMWKFILAAPKNFSVTYDIRKVVGDFVFVVWTAKYTFSATGRNVVNQGSTAIKVQDGKIVLQRDNFDICRWFQMALPSVQSAPSCLSPDPFRAFMRKQILDSMVGK